MDLYENLMLKQQLNNTFGSSDPHPGTKDAQEYVNKLISKSSEKILCGPQCQKEKKIANLKQNYLEAELEMENAPSKVEETRKEYYVADIGLNGYNEMMFKEYTEQSNVIVEEKRSEFNKHMTEAQNTLQTWEILDNNYKNIKSLYNKYAHETEHLETNIDDTEKDLITNNRKTVYENQGISSLLSWYSILKWLYIIIFIIFVTVLLSRVYSTHHLYTFITLTISLLLYPFLILYIIDGGSDVINGISSMLPFNAYE